MAKLEKKMIRNVFFNRVRERDRMCRVCGTTAGKLDAHHITDRHKMPNGGYVLENGILLCEKCHRLAEEHMNDEIVTYYSPKWFYNMIDSSYAIAYKASLKLKWIVTNVSVYTLHGTIDNLVEAFERHTWPAGKGSQTEHQAMTQVG